VFQAVDRLRAGGLALEAVTAALIELEVIVDHNNSQRKWIEKKYIVNISDIKGIVHFENFFLKCFSLPQGHPRCRCLCFHSVFNFDI